MLVQRTGWGKSAVYFIATRMLRDRGAGPTLLVSPLLALMRNQIEAAERMDVYARSIDSTNRKEWHEVEDALGRGEIDVLLISPERLANQQFRTEILPEFGGRSGLLVVDEAHCISDWGHDFRPDYRRITRVLDLLPRGVPVLCCTATANDRVIGDVVQQLGSGLVPVRGPLGRDGLRLQVVELSQPAQRMAWLAEVIPRLAGTGIVYCLTVADTVKVATFLRSQAISAVSYSGSETNEDRRTVERQLLGNDVKVVVATSALGMGFDKPDLAFVIHYQSPGSAISYYQQVGRAGRGLTESHAVLLTGAEDVDIQDYFIETAFPDAALARHVVRMLQTAAVPVSEHDILRQVNMRSGRLAQLLKNLEVDGAIVKDGGRWLRTLSPWTFDDVRVVAITAQRRLEQRQMRSFVGATTCRMKLLRTFLDDRATGPCGICDVCSGPALVVAVPPELVQRALRHIRRTDQPIEPRSRTADRSVIARPLRLEIGRVLSTWGDGGWGELVKSGKVEGRFDQRLVDESVRLIARWTPKPFPTWLTYVPSLRHPELVADFADRLGSALGLRCQDVVVKTVETAPQKTMENSARQYANLRNAFVVRTPISDGPVLLVDDIVDSRWTFTVVGQLLISAGSGPVAPFALANTAERSAR